MVDRSLQKYISAMRKRGFSDNLIKLRLLQSGYPNNYVDQALHKTLYKTKHHILKPTTLLFLISLFIIVGGGILFTLYLTNSSPVQTKSTLSISIPENQYQPNDQIRLTHEITGLQNTQSISYTHHVIDQTTQEIMHEVTQTTSRAQATSTIELPSNIPKGEFILRTIARTQDTQLVQTTTFEVIEESSQNTFQDPPSPQTPPPQPQEESDQSLAPTTTTLPQQDNFNTQPIPDIQSLSPFEALDHIQDLAKQDEQKAASECKNFDGQPFKDNCYAIVAEQTQKASYCTFTSDQLIKNECFRTVARITQDDTLCEQISQERTKDLCYLTFVREYNDYSVCFKIQNPSMKQSCEMLRDTT